MLRCRRHHQRQQDHNDHSHDNASQTLNDKAAALMRAVELLEIAPLPPGKQWTGRNQIKKVQAFSTAGFETTVVSLNTYNYLWSFAVNCPRDVRAVAYKVFDKCLMRCATDACAMNVQNAVT